MHTGSLWPCPTLCLTVKGFGIVNKAEIEVFLELSCFFNDPADVGNLSITLLETNLDSILKSRDTHLPKQILETTD